MNETAKVLTDYVIHKGMIGEENRSMYEYGFILVLETGFSMLISFCIAGVLHMTVEAILFFMVFIPLRSYAGGLHLDRYWACFILSCLTFSAILLVSKFLVLPVSIALAFFLILEISIYYMYPVENANRPVDKEEDRYFKNRLKKFLLLDGIIVFACIILKKNEYLILITATFLMVAVTMFLGKCKNSRRTIEKKLL